MAFSFPPPWRDWRAAVLLVAVACASPDRASAACGDHVTVLAPAAAASPDSRETTPPGAAELPPAPKLPCSGPNCTRAPERNAPPFAPAPTAEPPVKEVLQTLDAVEQSDGSSSRLSEFTPPFPVGRASSIFHPPRAS
jgi:hypothetical protein